MRAALIFSSTLLLVVCQSRTSTDDMLSTEGIEVAPSFDTTSTTMNVGEQKTFTIRGGKLPFSAKVLGTGTVSISGRICNFTAGSLIDSSSIIITDARGKQVSITIDAVGVAVQPTDMSGLTLWLKADTMSHPDATAIATWPDSSGNGRNFTNGTGAAQPIFVTNFLNGLPVVSFDGNDNLERTFDSGINTVNLSVFLLYNPATTASGSCPFSTRDSSSGLRGVWLCTGINNLFTSAFGTDALGPNWNYLHSVTPISANNWFLAEAHIDAQAISVSQNAVQQSQVSRLAVTYLEPLPASTRSARIGSTGELSATSYFSGKIAEVILFNRSLSANEQQSIRCYLKKKYALSYGC